MMRSEIDEFKRSNGNENFTQKEILMGIARKIERIEDKVSCIDNKVGGIKTSQKFHWLALSGLGAAVLFLFQHIFIGGF